jgi:hypothetical protein
VISMMRISLAAALVCLSGPCASASPVDPLWLKAVEITARNKAWVAGTVTINAEVYNEKDVLTDESVTVMRTFQGPDGKRATELVKSVKNGKDETEKDRKAFKDGARKGDNKGKSFSLTIEDTPFNAAIQDAVEARNLGETKTIDEKECLLFGFTIKRKDGNNFEGTAALDRASGAPVELSYTMKPLPLGVRSMTTVMKFGEGPEGGGFLREMLVNGAGSFLFITRSMSSTILLEDYWKTGEKPPA